MDTPLTKEQQRCGHVWQQMLGGDQVVCIRCNVVLDRWLAGPENLRVMIDPGPEVP